MWLKECARGGKTTWEHFSIWFFILSERKLSSFPWPLFQMNTYLSGCSVKTWVTQGRPIGLLPDSMALSLVDDARNLETPGARPSYLPVRRLWEAGSECMKHLNIPCLASCPQQPRNWPFVFCFTVVEMGSTVLRSQSWGEPETGLKSRSVWLPSRSILCHMRWWSWGAAEWWTPEQLAEVWRGRREKQQEGMWKGAGWGAASTPRGNRVVRGVFRCVRGGLCEGAREKRRSILSKGKKRRGDW